MDKKIVYDVIIIGAGPAGITAAIYARKADLKVLIIEKAKIGGQVAETFEVLNYTGIEKISGQELAKNMENHLNSCGAVIVKDEVQNCDLLEDVKIVKCFKNTYYGFSVIIANGTSVRPLDVEKQNNLIGRGISYSAGKDRDKYTDKIVAVVGGGNCALEEALFLSKKAKLCYLIHRRDCFRGNKSLIDRAKSQKNIEYIMTSQVCGLIGKEKLDYVTIQNLVSKEKKDYKIDCLFVAIGRGADTEFIASKIEKTSEGFILCNTKMESSIPGVYGAGDIRNTELRQIVSATSDGAIAATSAYNYLMKKRGKSYE